MKLNHLEQMCWAFKGENPALGAMMADTFQRDIRDGFELEPIEDNGEALDLIESRGFEAAKRAAIGDYFWHPKCAKCERCRRHRPECYYDQQRGREVLTCNRCHESMKADR